ncbi:glycosyltransferase family 2 protein [Candidatus Saccharibacteria bacterium]|nr:glycosyltransferase family 2 protein [Candidatus Saccharibacteria bacterium]
MSAKIVTVLLSTYNGEKYLKEQIDSIISQTGVSIRIIVRDDGSSDGTKKILEEYRNKNLLEWYDGPNLKPAKSFLDLMKHAGKSDYYAFADQDDFWEPEKIKNALKYFSAADATTPQLYFSNKKIVDHNLKLLADESGKKYDLSFGASMVRNIATGCTMVFNRALLELVNSYSPKYVSMHDAWMYRLCLATAGKVYFDEDAFIKYRQHSGQSIGAEGGFISRVLRRIKSFFRCDHSRELTAKEMLKGYKKVITPEYYSMAKQVANYRMNFSQRLSLARDKRFRTEKAEQNVVFILAALLGKI